MSLSGYVFSVNRPVKETAMSESEGILGQCQICGDVYYENVPCSCHVESPACVFCGLDDCDYVVEGKPFCVRCHDHVVVIAAAVLHELKQPVDCPCCGYTDAPCQNVPAIVDPLDTPVTLSCNCCHRPVNATALDMTCDGVLCDYCEHETNPDDEISF